MPVQKYIEGLGLRFSKPKLNPAADFSRHQLSALEGFILSRVDGNTSYGEICAISGLGEPRTAEVLIKLKAARLILAEGEPVPKPRAAHTPTPVAAVGRKKDDAAAAEKKKKADEQQSLLARLDDRSPVDPLILAECPELDETFKMRLLRVHRRLSEIDPFRLLGVEPGADKKALKRGYFQASKELHPDRYYGRDVGRYQQILTDIFAQAKNGFEALMAMDDEKRARFAELVMKRDRSEAAKRR